MSGKATRADREISDDARERLLSTAYALFTRHGIAPIGVDRIVAEAGVAKTTLYRHFGSKDGLVVAALELRGRLWTEEWLAAWIDRRGGPPHERLLAMFDAFDEWFQREDYEACFFTNSLLESRDRASVVGAASVRGLENVRELTRALAAEAGIRAVDRFAQQWQLLLLGAIIQAFEGHADAARSARDVAGLLLERELPA